MLLGFNKQKRLSRNELKVPGFGVCPELWVLSPVTSIFGMEIFMFLEWEITS